MAFASCLSVPAFGATIPGLSQSAFADTEVSTNIVFVVERPAMTRIEFTVALDAMFQIQGWNVASALNFPQPGYVAIRPSNGPNGHMGILDFDGMAISAQADLVTSRSDIPNSGIEIYRKHTEE